MSHASRIFKYAIYLCGIVTDKGIQVMYDFMRRFRCVACFSLRDTHLNIMYFYSMAFISCIQSVGINTANGDQIWKYAHVPCYGTVLQPFLLVDGGPGCLRIYYNSVWYVLCIALTHTAMPPLVIIHYRAAARKVFQLLHHVLYMRCTHMYIHDSKTPQSIAPKQPPQAHRFGRSAARSKETCNVRECSSS